MERDDDTHASCPCDATVELVEVPMTEKVTRYIRRNYDAVIGKKVFSVYYRFTCHNAPTSDEWHPGMWENACIARHRQLFCQWIGSICGVFGYGPIAIWPFRFYTDCELRAAGAERDETDPLVVRFKYRKVLSIDPVIPELMMKQEFTLMEGMSWHTDE